MDEFFALMAEVSASQAGMTVLRTDCEDDDESARPVTRSDLDSRHPLDEASDSVSSDFSWHMKVAEPPGSEPKTSMSYSINNITAKEEARSLTATITLDADPAYTQVQMAFQLDAEAHTTTRFRTVYLTALSAAMAHCQARA